MQVVDVPREAAESALVVIAHHVPLLVEIGRPILASAIEGGVQLLTEAGTWWVVPGRVERLSSLPDGRSELTCWSGRVELSRVIDTV